MRGDRVAVMPISVVSIGSSPHAWGQVVLVNPRGGRLRFIPTCVGTGFWRSRLERKSLGSSPHAWGQGRGGYTQSCAPRFIPTCVGTGLNFVQTQSPPEVHPHMRGDRARSTRWMQISAGSSPHAWGQGNSFRFLTHGLRFIPTCVGTGIYRPRQLDRQPVHPHMRGDRRALNVK